MSLTNTRTTELLRVQFNPERLSEKIEAVFNELEIQGHSHQVLQFKHSKNLTVDFELRFDALVQREWDADRIEEARRFLMSLAQPSRGDRVGTVDPPPVLFVWPRLYAIVARIYAPSFEHVRFAATGAPTLTIARVAIKQVLDARRTSEDLRRDGTKF
jgi:hypothetical protein